MTNLTDNLQRIYRGQLRIASLPVTGGTPSAPKTVFIGEAIEEQGDGGMLAALGTGTTFSGIALQKGVNTAGIGKGPNIEVATAGEFLLPVAVSGNVVRTNVGATVYLSDGNSFTTTSTSNQSIGKIVEVPESEVGLATGKLWVYIEGQSIRSL